MLLLNLVIAAGVTAVTNQDSACQFLVQLTAHLVLDPCNNIEIGNVQNIVTVQFLLLINGLGVSGTFCQGNNLFCLLLTLGIASCTCFFRSNVSKTGLYTAKRQVLNTVHNLANPGLVAVNKFGRVVQFLVFWEQSINPVNPIICLVAQKVLASFFQGQSAFLGSIKNGFNVAVGQYIFMLGTTLVKNIFFHIAILLIIVFRFIVIFCSIYCYRNRSIGNLLLAVRHAVKHIPHGFLIFRFLCFFCGFFFTRFFLCRLCVIMLQAFAKSSIFISTANKSRIFTLFAM